MDTILSLKSLRESTFRHISMRDLISLEQTSRLARYAVRHYTYTKPINIIENPHRSSANYVTFGLLPRIPMLIGRNPAALAQTSEVEGGGEVVKYSSAGATEAATGAPDTPLPQEPLVLRGPLLDHIKISLVYIPKRGIECKWIQIHQLLDLYSAEVSRVTIILRAGDVAETRLVRYDPAATATRTLHMIRCRELELSFTRADDRLLVVPSYLDLLARFPMLKKLILYVALRVDNVPQINRESVSRVPLLSRLPVPQLLEELQIHFADYFSSAAAAAAIAKDSARGQGPKVVNFRSLRRLALRLDFVGSLDAVTGVDWLRSLEAHPLTKLETLAIDIHKAAPSWLEVFLLKISAACKDCWQGLCLTAAGSPLDSLRMFEDLRRKAPGWAEKLRGLKLTGVSPAAALVVLSGCAELRWVELNFQHSPTESVEGIAGYAVRLRPLVKLRRLKLEGTQPQDAWLDAVLRQAPVLENLENGLPSSAVAANNNNDD